MKPSFLILLFASLVLTFTSCKKDPCEENNPCVNGTCVSVDDEATCSCNTGYMGAKCDTKVNTLFLGTYTFADTCNSTSGPLGSQSYSVTISEGSGSIMSLNISNLFTLGETSTATIQSDNDSFVIASQGIDANRGTLTGSGELIPNQSKIRFTYSIDYGGGYVVTCEGIMAR